MILLDIKSWDQSKAYEEGHLQSGFKLTFSSQWVLLLDLRKVSICCFCKGERKK